MRHDNLPYLGKIKTSKGLESFWKTGVYASPSDIATGLGLQTAVANAPTRDVRRRAEREASEFILGFAKRCGVYVAGGTVAMSGTGEMVVSVPWFNDEPPEKWPDQKPPKLTVFDPNKGHPAPQPGASGREA